MKSNLRYQEMITYLKASLKSIRCSAVLVWDDRVRGDAVGALGVFGFCFCISRELFSVRGQQ